MWLLTLRCWRHQIRPPPPLMSSVIFHTMWRLGGHKRPRRRWKSLKMADSSKGSSAFILQLRRRTSAALHLSTAGVLDFLKGAEEFYDYDEPRPLLIKQSPPSNTTLHQLVRFSGIKAFSRYTLCWFLQYITVVALDYGLTSSLA